MTDVPSLRIGSWRLTLPGGPHDGRLHCESEHGKVLAERRFGQGTVSAWVAVPDDQALVARDDELYLLELPSLEVRQFRRLEHNVFRIALHPTGRWAALASGYQGNYLTYGNLFRLELPSLSTRPMLDIDREVVDCSFETDGRLHYVLGSIDESDDSLDEGWLEMFDAEQPMSVAVEPLVGARAEALRARGEPA